MRKILAEVGSNRRTFRNNTKALDWAAKKAIRSGQHYFYLTDSVSARTEKYQVDIRVVRVSGY